MFATEVFLKGLAVSVRQSDDRIMPKIRAEEVTTGKLENTTT